MNTRTRSNPQTAGARTWKAYRAHLLNETRLHLREPAALIFGAILPVVAVVVMVVFPAASEPQPSFGGLSVIQSYLPVLFLFSSSILGLTVLPGTLGAYREAGILKRLRTTPSSPISLLAALVTVIGGFALLVAALITAIPAFARGYLPEDLTGFAIAAVASTVSFIGMGTVLASVVSHAKAAPGIGNAIAVVMWAAAGMWYPRAEFPEWLRTIADLTPGGATADVMLNAGMGTTIEWQPLAVLTAWTLGTLAVAVRAFRWE